MGELEEMAARQARQLETQEQLLAAKAQRLRYLKSGGEAERLQRLREKVVTQEERLRKLRALRGKVQSNKHGNAVLSKFNRFQIYYFAHPCLGNTFANVGFLRKKERNLIQVVHKLKCENQKNLKWSRKGY